MGRHLVHVHVVGQVVAYNNESLNYWSEPFEIIDRYELARYITPYGINLTLGPDRWAWVFDVTDYAPLPKDGAVQCGNWQELLDLKFAFIEDARCGKCDRVLEGHPLPEQLGCHHFAPNLRAGRGRRNVAFENAREWPRLWPGKQLRGVCYNTHSVKVNDTQEWSWKSCRSVRTTRCTHRTAWIYDRAGWCPGARAHRVDPTVAGQDNFTVEARRRTIRMGITAWRARSSATANMAHDVEVMDILAQRRQVVVALEPGV